MTVPVLVVKVHYRRWAAINRPLRSGRCILSMGKIGPLRICTQTLEKLHYGRHEKDILVISQNSHGK